MRRRRRICRIGRTGIRCLALHSRRVSPCGRHCRHLVNGGVAANCSVFADELRAAVSRIDHAMPAQNMVYQNRVYSTKGVSSHLEPRCAAPTSSTASASAPAAQCCLAATFWPQRKLPGPSRSAHPVLELRLDRGWHWRVQQPAATVRAPPSPAV